MPERDVAADLSGMTIQKAAALKSHWRVSMAALIHRARDTGKLDDASYAQLFRRMSVLGYRKREPVPIVPEMPRFVTSVVTAFCSQYGYSVADVARLCCIGEAEFASRYVPPTSGLRIAN
jgi:Zn-dependent peptidase ImmA (M78 family)